VNKLNLSEHSNKLINELLGEGWEMMMHYGIHSSFCHIKEPCWEVDFTRKLDNGLWDNHEDGYSLDVNEAVQIAYDNIRGGKKLK
jgi:hypothetical protein